MHRRLICCDLTVNGLTMWMLGGEAWCNGCQHANKIVQSKKYTYCMNHYHNIYHVWLILRAKFRTELSQKLPLVAPVWSTIEIFFLFFLKFYLNDKLQELARILPIWPHFLRYMDFQFESYTNVVSNQKIPQGGSYQKQKWTW